MIARANHPLPCSSMLTMEEEEKKKKKKKKGRGAQEKKISKQQAPLNPNWAQLQQKLKSYGSKPSRQSKESTNQAQKCILGKRKERADVESVDSHLNPLTPTNDDLSLTREIGMDCEMVGVTQGNKSALGRVTLVNRWGNVTYDEFVRPVERVVDFRTQISGIRPQDLRKVEWLF